MTARSNRELTLTNLGLVEANRTQADLIALLAHDTRQPLTVSRGYLELTIDEWATTTDDVRLHQLGNAARATGAAMSELVEDTLTLASLDAGTVTSRSVHTLVAAGSESPRYATARRTASRARR